MFGDDKMQQTVSKVIVLVLFLKTVYKEDICENFCLVGDGNVQRVFPFIDTGHLFKHVHAVDFPRCSFVEPVDVQHCSPFSNSVPQINYHAKSLWRIVLRISVG